MMQFICDEYKRKVADDENKRNKTDLPMNSTISIQNIMDTNSRND